MVQLLRVDAAVWVAECEHFEDSIQVSHPRTKNFFNVGGKGEIWTSENYV